MSSEQNKPCDLEQLLVAPFHRWLGLNLVALTRDELVLEMPWRDEIVSNRKIASAHGDILSALIDLTGLYTILAFGGTARATIDLHVDFHRPATPGQLRAIGRPVKMGRQMSVAETRIVRADGTSWRVEEALMLAARLAALRSCLILARMPFALRQSHQADRASEARASEAPVPTQLTPQVLGSGSRLQVLRDRSTRPGWTTMCLASAARAEARGKLCGAVASQEIERYSSRIRGRPK